MEFHQRRLARRERALVSGILTLSSRNRTCWEVLVLSLLRTIVAKVSCSFAFIQLCILRSLIFMQWLFGSFGGVCSCFVFSFLRAITDLGGDLVWSSGSSSQRVFPFLITLQSLKNSMSPLIPMEEQSWVMQSRDRSSDEPQEMQQAADNRRRILGSSLFGDSSPRATNYAPPPPRNPPPPPPPTYARQEDTYDAVDNRRKVMGSSIFGGTVSPPRRDAPAPPQFGATQAVAGGSRRPVNFAATMPVSAQPFPDLTFDTSPPIQNMGISFKPRQFQAQGQGRRLEVQRSPEMRRLKNEMDRDTADFEKRIRQIGKL